MAAQAALFRASQHRLAVRYWEVEVLKVISKLAEDIIQLGPTIEDKLITPEVLIIISEVAILASAHTTAHLGPSARPVSTLLVTEEAVIMVALAVAIIISTILTTSIPFRVSNRILRQLIIKIIQMLDIQLCTVQIISTSST